MQAHLIIEISNRSMASNDEITVFISFRTVENLKENEGIQQVSSFCSDFSFWHDKKFEGNYTYHFNNTGYENKNPCPPKESFYCKMSDSCIPKNFMCDGSVNCFYAEDEDFELCKSFFPEAATVKCEEANRTHYNISILATPCDGILGTLLGFMIIHI